MSSRRGLGRKGTHGSLSKAGKQRSLNKPFWKVDEKGHRTHHNKKHKIPRLRNRSNYHRRVELVQIYGEKTRKRR